MYSSSCATGVLWLDLMSLNPVLVTVAKCTVIVVMMREAICNEIVSNFYDSLAASR